MEVTRGESEDSDDIRELRGIRAATVGLKFCADLLWYVKGLGLGVDTRLWLPLILDLAGSKERDDVRELSESLRGLKESVSPPESCTGADGHDISHVCTPLST